MSIDKKTALRRIDAFAALPEPILDRLEVASGLQRIGRGSTLFREGERAHFVHAIVEGRVSLVSGSESNETIADFLESGEIVLIPPALLDLPYMATGRAEADVLALLIPTSCFRELAETELPFAVAVNRLLARHWRLLMQNLKQSKTRDADTKLAHYLLNRVRPGGDAVTIALPVSKRQLAAHLGMQPETLSRAFRRLEPHSVSSKGSAVMIRSVSRLADFIGTQSNSKPTAVPHAN